jgi:nicotinate phosphoribosyltransferase
MNDNKLDSLDVDFYAFTQLYAWFNNYKNNKTPNHLSPAVMEAFCRKQPNDRKFFVFCGLGRIIDYLQNLKFTDLTIDFLCSKIKSKNTEEFKEYLRSVDFAKEIKLYAPEEGDIIFANEPMVRLEGSIGLLEYVEKRILSILNTDVKVASKAARIYLAAKGKTLIEMSGRREHENSSTARSAYIAGFNATSSPLAEFLYAIPSFGSMAHVMITSHDSEKEAFQNWADAFENSTYLTDTYEVYDGLENALKAAPDLSAIRLDSGDLASLAFGYRMRLNKRNNIDTKITATNDLDEYKITKLNGAPIDIFGVGTSLTALPSIGVVYKLVKIYDIPKCKLSAEEGKSTLPDVHQVWRHYAITKNNKYMMTHDTIDIINSNYFVESDICRPLIKEHKLNISYDQKELVQKARNKFLSVLAELPDYLKLIPKDPKEETTFSYVVEISNHLGQLKQELFIKYKNKSA